MASLSFPYAIRLAMVGPAHEKAETDPQKRQALFDKLLAQQYEKGKALEVATVLEIDAVIEPCDTRKMLISALT